MKLHKAEEILAGSIMLIEPKRFDSGGKPEPVYFDIN
jgi:hypothetical protein